MRDLTDLAQLLNGWLDDETDASREEAVQLNMENAGKTDRDRRRVPPGFARDSVAWQVAVEFDLPLVEVSESLPTKAPEPDLFAPAPVVIAPRYQISDVWFGTSHSYGGEPVEDAVDSDELADESSYALAWDAKAVVFACPRAQACTISRERWLDGWRMCGGC